MATQEETTISPIDPATDPAIESRTKAFLNTLNSGGGKPMEQMSPAEARRVLEGAQQSVEVDLSGVYFAQQTIAQDGLSIDLDIVRPIGVSGTLPVFMFFHGGGWVLGDFPTHQRLVRDLVVESGAVAVFVNYTRSPEARFPTALTEAYAATKWVAENGAELNVDGSRLAVIGNSAGGDLTAAVALMAKDKKGPTIKLQVLLWPVTSAEFDTVSYHQYARDRFLTRNMMIWFWDNYAPNPEDRQSYYAAPLQASLDQLKGLPPALVQVAENDVLRDEGEAYARKLDEAGVSVTLIRYQGMIHDWGLLNPLAHIPGTRSLITQAAAELKKFL
ncbi:esterase / lipase [Fibrisoma limi BUZ 3]|uniref:Esterase / lipase n=1 Tax=Fibrisoma limi BUZ 3 TaxID=1185876 RepID=I2GLS1_9BACT|nr:alpha/beta hydrolase [Fibrisoma limi]CCH54847.1 esterase / lipase [Fibrisoma limi BUZ 3]